MMFGTSSYFRENELARNFLVVEDLLIYMVPLYIVSDAMPCKFLTLFMCMYML